MDGCMDLLPKQTPTSQHTSSRHTKIRKDIDTFTSLRPCFGVVCMNGLSFCGRAGIRQVTAHQLWSFRQVLIFCCDCSGHGSSRAAACEMSERLRRRNNQTWVTQDFSGDFGGVAFVWEACCWCRLPCRSQIGQCTQCFRSTTQSSSSEVLGHACAFASARFWSGRIQLLPHVVVPSVHWQRQASSCHFD